MDVDSLNAPQAGVFAPRPAARTAAAPAIDRLAIGVFTTTLFLSSGLIFLVEPMFAKMVLPQLGGSPEVWNTCVVFFQLMMLAAYGYAHLTSTRLRLSHQVALHVTLLAAAAAALPVAIPDGWAPPVDHSPVFWLFSVLLVGVGAPFFVVAASAPLLQRWFSRLDHPSAADPYFLYAASNLGSIVALLAYPLVVEPASTLSRQSSLWSAGFLLLIGLTIVCATAMTRRSRPASMRDAATDLAVPVQQVTWRSRVQWLALSGVPSSLMLGVTSYLSTDIAAVPLLWTVPLTLYLLSFVLAFASTPVRVSSLISRLMPVLVLPVALLLMARASGPVGFVAPLHLLAFFVCAWRLHLELSRTRPGVSYLTEFYVWIAVGGLLGGMFNTLLAPVLFDGIVEYPAGIVAACLLLRWSDATAACQLTTADLVMPVVAGAITAAVAAALSGATMDPRLAIVLFAPMVVWCFSFSRRPVRFAGGVAMLLLGSQLWVVEAGTPLLTERTFFGVLRVREDTAAGRISMSHGTTLHGEQSTRGADRQEPLTYYHRTGPIGQVFAAISPRLDRGRVAVIGLGAGSLAAYAQPGQSWTFYELDPAVAAVATTPRFFTYLQNCGNACGIVLGDARRSLARARGEAYDVMVLDAFSSDAIPVHLVTREALALYLTRLSADGLLAFHISNRHLDLRPILAALAAEHGLAAFVQTHRVDRGDTSKRPSVWVVMGRSADAVAPLAHDDRWRPLQRAAGTPVWTDDYSDIVSALNAG